MNLQYYRVWTPNLVNYFLFFVGAIGVWTVTHSWLAIFWTFVASLHLNHRLPGVVTDLTITKKETQV